MWILITEDTSKSHLDFNFAFYKKQRRISHSFNGGFSHSTFLTGFFTNISQYKVLNSNNLSLSINKCPTSRSFFFNIRKRSRSCWFDTLIKPKTASGIDDESYKFLKSYSGFLANPLVNLIKLSFQTGVFPDFLKRSVVSPLFKQG